MLALTEAILEAARCSCGSGELGEVVGGADQGPFGLHFLDASQQELPEPPCLFDLSEDRLDGLFSPSIAASMAGAFKLGAHSFDQRAAALALGHRGLGAVLLPAGGNVALDPPPDDGPDIDLAAVAGVGRGFFGVRPRSSISSMSGTSWSWSLMLCVRPWATMIWACASTAACAL